MHCGQVTFPCAKQRAACKGIACAARRKGPAVNKSTVFTGTAQGCSGLVTSFAFIQDTVIGCTCLRLDP